jgi:hypothetical protein
MPDEAHAGDDIDDPDDWRFDADDPETSLNEAMDAAGFPEF